MADVVLSNVNLDVFGGPSSVDVSVDFGQTGIRGSKIWLGDGDPLLTLSGQEILINDVYINTLASDPYYGWLYQYIETPGNPAWQRQYQILQGLQGIQGITGSFGGAAFEYVYSTNTQDTDPLVGKLKFNNADLSLATELYISKVDFNNLASNGFLQTIDDSTSGIKGHFNIKDLHDESVSAMFAITGTLTDHTAYITLPIGYLSGSTSLTNNEHVLTTFARTGDVGDQGIQGTQGLQGLQGLQGVQGTQGLQGLQGEQGLQGFGYAQLQGIQGTEGLQGIQGTQGTQGVQGLQGLQGVQGITGSFGGAALDYLFSTNTSNTAPSTGYVKFNNSDLSLATVMYIHFTDDNSDSAYSFLQTIDDSTSNIKGHFSLTSQNEPDLFDPILFAITGSHSEDLVNNYFSVPISYLSGGTPSIANDYHVVLTFARNGDKGDTGLQGTQGIQGLIGLQGTQGTQGLQGETGLQGLQGLQGTLGLQGIQGTIGLQGLQGTAAPILSVNTTAKTGAYTLTSSDYNTLIQMNAGAAFTIDTSVSGAPTGTQFTLVALTSGVTVNPSGVTVYATPGLKLRAAYSTATLICLDTNVWLLTGDITA